MRGQTVYRETGRKEKRGRKKREGNSQYSILKLIAIHKYLLVLQILENTGILVFTSICTSIADTGRFW
jgi:hypothetical protein